MALLVNDTSGNPIPAPPQMSSREKLSQIMRHCIESKATTSSESIYEYVWAQIFALVMYVLRLV